MERSRDDGVPSGPTPGLPRVAPGVVDGRRFGRALERWAADAAVDEAARSRLRERWLRVQSEESASVLGTLVDLAERGAPVTLDVAGQRARGRVVGVGGDFVALRAGGSDGGDHDVLVRLRAIDVVRVEPGGVAVRGDRSKLLEVTLDAVVGPLAAERPEVLVRTWGGAAVRGELRSAGTDVLAVRVDGDPPSPTWVPLWSVTMLRIRG